MDLDAPTNTSAPAETPRLVATTGEFRCADTELAFRRRMLEGAGERIGRHGMYLAAILMAFALSDLATLGPVSEWFVLLAMRSVASAAVALVALAFRRDPLAHLSGPRAASILAAEAAAMAVFLVVCWVRPEDVVAHAVSAVLLVLVVVLFVPGRVRSTAALVLAFLVGLVAVAAARFDMTPATLASFAGALSASAFVTFGVAANLNRAVRTEWATGAQVRAANERLLDEARRAEQLRTELEWHATKDALTGLANRRWFFTRGDEIIAAARRGGRSVTTLLMDADGFKLVNDRYGHAVGDAVLQALGGALAATARRGELVGRLGGEEFAVVADGLDEAGARSLAERLRSAVRHATVEVDGEPVGVTVSVGFTEVTPTDTLAEALVRADRAMYEAKRSGGDRTLCGVA